MKRNYSIATNLLTEMPIASTDMTPAAGRALKGLKRQVGGGKAQKAVAAAIVSFGRNYDLSAIDVVATSSHNTDVYVDGGGDSVPCEAKANSGTFDISRFLAAADTSLKGVGRSKRKTYANHARYNKPSSPPPTPSSSLLAQSAATIISLDEFICITDSALTEMYVVYVPDCQEHGAAARSSGTAQSAIKTKLFGAQASKIPTVAANTIGAQLSGSWRYVEKTSKKTGKKTWSWRFELSITKKTLENLGAQKIDLASAGINEVQIHIDFFINYVTSNRAQIKARTALSKLCGVSLSDLTKIALTFNARGSSALQSIYHKSSDRYLPVVLNPDDYPSYGTAFKAALSGFQRLARDPNFELSDEGSTGDSVLGDAGASDSEEEEIAGKVEEGKIETEADWEAALNNVELQFTDVESAGTKSAKCVAIMLEIIKKHDPSATKLTGYRMKLASDSNAAGTACFTLRAEKNLPALISAIMGKTKWTLFSGNRSVIDSSWWKTNVLSHIEEIVEEVSDEISEMNKTELKAAISAYSNYADVWNANKEGSYGGRSYTRALKGHLVHFLNLLVSGAASEEEADPADEEDTTDDDPTLGDTGATGKKWNPYRRAPNTLKKYRNARRNSPTRNKYDADWAARGLSPAGGKNKSYWDELDFTDNPKAVPAPGFVKESKYSLRRMLLNESSMFGGGDSPITFALLSMGEETWAQDAEVEQEITADSDVLAALEDTGEQY